MHIFYGDYYEADESTSYLQQIVAVRWNVWIFYPLRPVPPLQTGTGTPLAPRDQQTIGESLSQPEASTLKTQQHDIKLVHLKLFTFTGRNQN